MIAARQALDALFAGPRLDGVVACSDLLALQAVQAARASGFDVPRDVAVVGYDDMPVATYSDPPLTTVHQPVQTAGIEIVDALLALLRGERAAPRVLPVHLVVRDSA
jgi:DNA-binding LacI/PurR family transcriptional regulator